MRLLKICSCLALLGGLAACDDNDDSGSSGPSGGDRQAMLSNMGQNIILPNYEAFNDKAQSLKEANQTFQDQTNTENLKAVRNAFKATYKAFQRVKTYGFGPAQQIALRSEMNTYPTDTKAIEKRVNNANTEWGPFDNDTKGLPGLDYLLYRHDDAGKVIEQYQSESGANRRDYLQAVVNDIAGKAKNVHQRWKPSDGDYLTTFQEATGNDKGSSLALLVNQLNFDFEFIKDEKLGIPAGKKSMGETFPKKVEAYYSGMSVPLMRANLKAIENLYLGRHNGTNGPGLDDRLDETDAKRDGEKLSKVIIDQFSQIDQIMSEMPRPLSKGIKQGEPRINEGFTAVQRQVIFLKTDMTSALGVRITYQDNDGD